MTVELMTRLVEAVEGLAITAGIFTGFCIAIGLTWLIVKK